MFAKTNFYKIDIIQLFNADATKFPKQKIEKKTPSKVTQSIPNSSNRRIYVPLLQILIGRGY